MVTNCEKCGIQIVPHPTRRFCGSIKEKTGCAYKRRLDYQCNLMKDRYKDKPKWGKQSLHTLITSLPDNQEPEYQPQRYEYWFTKAA